MMYDLQTLGLTKFALKKPAGQNHLGFYPSIKASSSSSMQDGWFVIASGFEVLLFDDLKAFLGLDAIKDNSFVYALDNGKIATCLIVLIQPVWIEGLPKSIVIKRVEPFIQILSVFELLHASSLPRIGVLVEANSTETSTLLAICTLSVPLILGLHSMILLEVAVVSKLERGAL